MKKHIKTYYSFMSLCLLGIVSSGTFIGTQVGQAQKQESTKVSQEGTMKPETKKTIGTLRGLDELKAVLESSEPTKSPKVRRLIISVPSNLPEHFRLLEAARTAIREFIFIANRESLDLDNIDQQPPGSLESEEGKKAKLSNGGTIALRIKKIKENKLNRSTAELVVKDHNISGYEEVTKIEFDTQ
jgi:hypothetical protein